MAIVLAASCDKLPARVEKWGFTRDVLAFLGTSLADCGDRERLVALLSKRCPNRIHWPENVEFYLAVRAKRLRDPILILGEAYSKSQVPETRHALAAAVRRGFVDLGIRGKDDAEYVKNAMQWYVAEEESSQLATLPYRFPRSPRINSTSPTGVPSRWAISAASKP